MKYSQVDALWAQIEKAFPNGAFMRPNASWWSGMASGSSSDRMRRLTQSGPARKLEQILAGATPAVLSQLLVHSEVNLDQAQAGLRLTLVANISIPVGALVFFNQVVPGRVTSMVDQLPLVATTIAVSLVVVMLLGVIWFAYAGVAAAQNLNHLLRLRLAGMAAGVPSRVEADGDVLDVLPDLS